MPRCAFGGNDYVCIYVCVANLYEEMKRKGEEMGKGKERRRRKKERKEGRKGKRDVHGSESVVDNGSL